MNRNVGSIDRGVRALAGIGLIGLTLAGTIGPWGWIGIVALGTAVVGWCPLYRMLGMDTCGTK